MSQRVDQVTRNSRQSIAAMVQTRLADAIDLASRAREAKWNVATTDGTKRKQTYDRLATRFEDDAERLATRLQQLGVRVEGAIKPAAQLSTIKPTNSPVAASFDRASVLAELVSEYGHKFRNSGIEAKETGDQKTFEVCWDIHRGADVSLWELGPFVV